MTLVDCKHLYGVIIFEAPKWGIRAHTPQQMGGLLGHYKRQVPYVPVRPVIPFQVSACNSHACSQGEARYSPPCCNKAQITLAFLLATATAARL